MHALAPIIDLPGLPGPLWIGRSCQTDDSLVPAACEPVKHRRTWLLLVCVDGSIPLQREEQIVDLVAGQALLLEHPCPALNLRPDAAAWQALLFGFIGFDELIDTMQQEQGRFRLPLDGWAVRQLWALAEQPPEPLVLAAAMRLVSGVLANLIEHNCDIGRRDESSELLRRAISLIEKAIEGDANIAAIAQELAVSPGHFARHFRSQLGMSPSRYLKQRRMRRACEWLRSAGADISDIAARLGYQSVSSFGAAFKEVIGLSPAAYRDSRSVPLWRAGDA
jgi:AraC-like DNA-binding protein